jgi:hypothetical protein
VLLSKLSVPVWVPSLTETSMSSFHRSLTLAAGFTPANRRPWSVTRSRRLIDLDYMKSDRSRRGPGAEFDLHSAAPRHTTPAGADRGSCNGRSVPFPTACHNRRQNKGLYVTAIF